MELANLTSPGTTTVVFASRPRGSGAGGADASPDVEGILSGLGASTTKRMSGGVLGAFSRASDAVIASLESVRGVGSGRDIAIALTSGDPGRTSDLDSRCMALSALAGPGQIVVAASTAGLVSRLLPPGASLVDIGRQRSGPSAEPDRVYLLAHPELPSGPRPVASGHAWSLPSPWTTFVGRHGDLDHLKRLLSRPGLITLTGLGGSGKTRLAIELAATIAGDGAAFVDLRATHGWDAVLRAVANALGLPAGFATGTGRPLADEIVAALTGSDVLLVLDNCEDLLDECASLAWTLLSACPRLKLLATSREPLGVSGEIVYPVRPLDCRPGAEEALLLFADRARAAAPGFTMDTQTAATAHDICRKLDGLPLAIELAAARVAHMSVAQIAQRLDDRFSLLGRTGQGGTLLTTLDWSHGHLGPGEYALFRRLSVFPGSWTLEAAEALCQDGEGSVLDDLSSLVAKSLVIVDHESAAIGYRMLETVRVYALAKLREAGEEQRYRSAYRDLVLLATESIPPERSLFSVVAGMDLVDRGDDVRAALMWSEEQDRPDLVARLLVSTFMAWAYWGRDEADRWCRWVLERIEALPADLAARTTSAGALIAMTRYDAEALLDRSGRTLQTTGGSLAEARVVALYCRAVMTVLVDPDGARGMALEALSEPSGHVHRSLAASGYGDVLILSGDREAARDAYSDAVALADPSEFWPAFFSQCGLAISNHLLGEPSTALEAARSAVSSASRHPNPMFRSLGDFCLGLALAGSGHAAEARDALSESVETLDRALLPGAVKQLLIPLAAAALEEGHAATASKLLAASGGTARIPAAVAAYQQLVADARAGMAPDEAKAARSVGRSLSLDEALSLGFAAAEPGMHVRDVRLGADREDRFRI